MKIQNRIQDAFSRRHKNENGFTLIELLVVILIIAILAAVAIFALLSSLDSAKKSNATTLVSSAQVSVQSVRANQGNSDFVGITFTDLNNSEKDITFTNNTTPTAEANEIQFANTTAGVVTLIARDKSFCYRAVLSVSAKTMYTKSTNDPCTSWGTADADKKVGWK